MLSTCFFKDSDLLSPLLPRATKQEINLAITCLWRLNEALHRARNGKVESALNEILDSKKEGPGLLKKVSAVCNYFMKKTLIYRDQDAENAKRKRDFKISIFTSSDDDYPPFKCWYKDSDLGYLYQSLEDLLYALQDLNKQSFITYQHFEANHLKNTSDFLNVHTVLNKLFFSMQDRIRFDNNVSKSTPEGSYVPPVVR